MSGSKRLLVWTAVTAVVVVLSVPWLMWGSDTVVGGLPVWVWWHVGWLGLTTIVLWVFTRRAWGLGIEEVSPDG